MGIVHAIFENGVFRPREPVALPNGSEVEFEPRLVSPNGNGHDALARIYDILNQRYDTGETDVAERHNEHQP
jgi:predicted DNA-binding antitoxin AbrB/MazE fold protein